MRGRGRHFALLVGVLATMGLAAAPAQAQVPGTDQIGGLLDPVCDLLGPIDALDPITGTTCPRDDAAPGGGSGGGNGSGDPPAQPAPACKVTALGAIELAPGVGAFFGTVLDGARSLSLFATTENPPLRFGTLDVDRTTCTDDRKAMTLEGQALHIRGEDARIVDYSIALGDGGPNPADDSYRLTLSNGVEYDTGVRKLAFGGVEIAAATTP